MLRLFMFASFRLIDSCRSGLVRCGKVGRDGGVGDWGEVCACAWGVTAVSGQSGVLVEVDVGAAIGGWYGVGCWGGWGV